MSEIVQREIKMKIYKAPYTNSKMHEQMLDEDIKIKKLPQDRFYLGEIYVDGRIYGVLGMEKEYWSSKSTPDLDYLDRLILTLYDKKGKTAGLIEERVLKELMQSAVNGKLPVFTITLRGIPYMIDIEKESDKLVFPLLTNKSKNIFEIFQLSKKTLAIGADFVVTRKLTDQKVADIDSRRGGKIEIKIYDSEVADNRQLTEILVLFAATISFHESISKKIEQAIDALKLGSLVLKPPAKALELMINPRKAKRKKAARDEEDEAEEEPTERPKIRRKKRKIRGADEDTTEAPPKKRRRPIIKSKKTTDEIVKKKFKELFLDDPPAKASGVTKEIGAKLEELGILTIEDFLSANPKLIAAELGSDSITATRVKRWMTASRKRVKQTLDTIEAEPDDSADYDLLDQGY